MALGIKLSLYYIKLAFHLVILFTESVSLVLLLVKLNSVSAFHVFLDFHAQNVSIYG